ncbi:hypothetical protein GCM10027046_03750 [Uliginosibacterium flavum]
MDELGIQRAQNDARWAGMFQHFAIIPWMKNARFTQTITGFQPAFKIQKQAAKNQPPETLVR